MTDAAPDPGWRPTLLAAVPLLGPLLASRRQADGLLTIRALFVSFVAAVALLTAILPVLVGPPSDNVPLGLAVALLLGVDLAALGLPAFVGGRLDCTTDESLARTYLARFFVRMAVAEVPALLGFVLGLADGRFALALLGLVPALVAFALVAPSRRALAREQERLELGGCGRSLVAALRSTPVGRTRRSPTLGDSEEG